MTTKVFLNPCQYQQVLIKCRQAAQQGRHNVILLLAGE